MVRIGRFRDFKGSDTVLIDADQNSLPALIRIFRHLASGTPTVDVSAESDVVVFGEIVLIAEMAPESGRVTEVAPGHFRWPGSPEYWAQTADKVAALLPAIAGHQYVEEPGPLQIIISVGEYGSEWWARHGGTPHT